MMPAEQAGLQSSWTPKAAAIVTEGMAHALRAPKAAQAVAVGLTVSDISIAADQCAHCMKLQLLQSRAESVM